VGEVHQSWSSGQRDTRGRTQPFAARIERRRKARRTGEHILRYVDFEHGEIGRLP
jgi:hypothetical protein